MVLVGLSLLALAAAALLLWQRGGGGGGGSEADAGGQRPCCSWWGCFGMLHVAQNVTLEAVHAAMPSLPRRIAESRNGPGVLPSRTLASIVPPVSLRFSMSWLGE